MIERRPDFETPSEKAVAQCILTHKFRSTQSRYHSDFHRAVKSIGPAPAHFIYCAVSDKMKAQIASMNWLF
jgi:hypothetical protein